MKRRRDRRFEEERHIHNRLWGTLLLSLIVAVVLVLPCFYWAGLYARVAGRVASVPVLLGITLCWVIAVYVVFVFLLLRLRHKVLSKRRHPQPNMFDEVLDALDRIASGDYNVSVQKQGYYHYSELADKVNSLARDLSSMEAMRQEFVSNVSHEIQSPLTSISGFAALLKKEELTPEQRLHYLDVIEAESRRLSGLSENLLRLSVLDSDQQVLSPRPFRLDKQIRDCLLVLEPQWLEKGIELDLDLEAVTCTGDADLLGQVWSNLLHNSIKFTPPGGSIAVRMREEDGEVVCVLSDTGAGIPEESLARIFERFYKADKARDRSLGGNGLGLSIVQRIVSLHGGTISVESEVGKGTAFTVTLPVGE